LIVCHIQQGTNDLHDYWNGSNIDADCTVWCQQSGILNRFLLDDVTPWTNGDTSNPTLSNPVINDIYINKIPIYGPAPNGTGIFNHYSLTVEHQGFDYTGITAAQAESTAQMAAYWCSIYNLDPMVSIVGHRDIGKKTCPGAKFPLEQVRARTKELLTAMNPNPYNYAVGKGFLDYLKDVIHEQAATEERYIKNAPGGVSVLRTMQGSLLMATQDIAPGGSYLPSWTITKLA